MTDDDSQASPLGARLDQTARRIAARHLVTYSWARGLAPMLQRTARLTETFQGRFERREALVGGPGEAEAWHVVPGPGRSMASADITPPPPAGAPPGASPRTGRPLPADVRARLREVAGRGADAMRVHDDRAADSTARAHRADAVTTGSDVYLRDGRFRPDEPAGFALLAHEATHVTALLEPGGAARRAAAAGLGAEEEAALAREQAAPNTSGPAGHGASASRPTAARPPGGTVMHPAPARLPGPPASAGPGGAPPAESAAVTHPMTAPVDRDLPQQAPFDLEELRRDLVSHLMRQLRTEFERGG